LHGICQDIAEQLSKITGEPTPKALVYMAICLEAADEQILPYQIVMGMGLPIHESRWSTGQCADVIELLYKRVSMLVAQYGVAMYVHEYTEDGKRAERRWIRP
jgi:hypothetical protein